MTGGAAIPALVLDASLLTAWILRQNRRWQKVHRLLQTPVSSTGEPVDLIAPVPALTESLYVARQHGNTSTYRQLHAAITSFGVQIEPSIEADALWAADRSDRRVGRQPGHLDDGIR